MVVNSKGEAESRTVKTGIQSGDQAQIVSGVKPGEQVISQGAYGLPDKTKVTIQKAEKPESASSGDKDKGKRRQGLSCMD